MSSHDDFSMDDFELKPITDGLGFHKKNNSKANDLPPLSAEPREATEKLEKRISQIPYDFGATPSPLGKSNDLFSKTLPRPEDIKTNETKNSDYQIPKFNPSRIGKPIGAAMSAPAAKNYNEDKKNQEIGIIDELVKNGNANHQQKTSVIQGRVPQTILEASESVAEPVKIKLIPDNPSFLTMFLDATVISGLTVLFTLALVVATQIDILPILKGIATDLGTQVGLALLVYSVAQLYLILTRSFFGQTLGEWSLDTQLGTNEEQQRLSYVFKLIGRTIIMTLTGLVLLPLISLIVGKDLSANISGLKLYRQS